MFKNLREAKRSEEADPYRGAQHQVAIRVTGFLWIVGPLGTCAASIFFPPTAQIGSLGWALVLPLAVLSLGFGWLALRLKIHPSWDLLSLSSLNGVVQIAVIEWLAGGGRAPFSQWLLLPTLAIATQRTIRSCLPVVLAAWAAALSPLLYSSIQLPSTIAEMALLSVMTFTVSAVMTSVRTHRAELRDAGEHAASLARIDPLTGLPNRRSFDEALSDAIVAARLQNRALSVMLCDVNSFKDVNDTFGHPAGDKCLKSIADALRQVVRRPDAVFRWAGDEFAVILSDADELSAGGGAARLSQAVRECCQRPDGTPITIGTGLATLREGMTPDQLVAEADVTLLEQKAARRREDAGWGIPSSA
jgi:diguanylate cyclase (GGDEF)-like protein